MPPLLWGPCRVPHRRPLSPGLSAPRPPLSQTSPLPAQTPHHVIPNDCHPLKSSPMLQPPPTLRPPRSSAGPRSLLPSRAPTCHSAPGHSSLSLPPNHPVPVVTTAYVPLCPPQPCEACSQVQPAQRLFQASDVTHSKLSWVPSPEGAVCSRFAVLVPRHAHPESVYPLPAPNLPSHPLSLPPLTAIYRKDRNGRKVTQPMAWSSPASVGTPNPWEGPPLLGHDAAYQTLLTPSPQPRCLTHISPQAATLQAPHIGSWLAALLPHLPHCVPPTLLAALGPHTSPSTVPPQCRAPASRLLPLPFFAPRTFFPGYPLPHSLTSSRSRRTCHLIRKTFLTTRVS